MTLPLLGAAAQLCFVLRSVVQWRAAERAGRSIVPRSFWWLSLGGALGMALYTAAGETTLLAGGFLASAWIAARNLRLQAGAVPASRGAEMAVVIGILVLSALIASADTPVTAPAWLAVLWLGQLLWSTRFAVQWIQSERIGASHLSPAFWRLSLAGNALLLAYALHVSDLVLVCAFAPGPLFQIRNLVLSAREPVRSVTG